MVGILVGSGFLCTLRPERGVMRFEIQWTGHQGAAMTHRDTAAEAIRFAIEMLGKDFTDVVIIDTNESAKTYRPFEFEQFYKNAKLRRCDRPSI
jgi:hypothetical protein